MVMVNIKRDYFLVTIIGFLVGLLVLIPAFNLGLKITMPIVLISVVGFSLFAPLAFTILNFLSRWVPVFRQFGKFAAAGTLNALIDLSILNLLIFVSGFASGVFYALFKSISFLLATTNSYLWNKFWTFESRLPVSGKEYIKFALFTLVGVIINVSVATSFVTFLGDGSKLAANIGALIGIFVALTWNFLSYKNVVFKSQIPSTK
ncbi:MAG: GtrA family protein [Patescibacteria group bacterium]|mgnify:FL=1